VGARGEDRPYQELLSVLKERWQPSKAAFYTLENNGSFRLRTQFGFTRADRLAEGVARTDPLTVQIYEHREPFFINNIHQAGRLAALMEAASSTRILIAPLYVDGRIGGILDVREKAGRALFTTDDLNEVADLLRRFAISLRKMKEGPAAGEPVMQIESNQVPDTSPTPPGPTESIETSTLSSASFNTAAFNTASFSTAGLRADASVAREAEVLRRGAAAPEPEADLSTAHLPGRVLRTLRLVEETLSRASSPRPPESLPPGTSPREAEFIRLYLPTCLQYPEVELAAVSTFLPNELAVTTAARRTMDRDVEPALQENLEKIFAKSAAGFPSPRQQTFKPMDLPVLDARVLRRSEIAAIQSSVLAAAPEGVVILSLLFRHGPASEGREGLRNVHVILKNALAEIRSEARFREAYRGLVNKLIEPGLKRRTALKAHSFNVGRMARKLATKLGLGSMEVEQITVAGILHDVGLGELNYDELYAKRSLNEEELKLLRQHPSVGAFIVDEIPWPYPVAPLVRHHHERWDGGGYPDGLRAEQIPLGARIIHLCEAFDAMTSPTSYRAVLSDYQALDILVSKAGTQFDPELAPAFRKMIEGQGD
jgi:hypothetical protein